MQQNRGFTLTEVLVSMLLIISISLAILKQQWQVSQLLNQIVRRFETLTQTDNQQESQQGFSLIELCISLFITTCLLTSLLHHYIEVKRQYIATQTNLEKAADLQLISETMRMSIRKAGFTPCLSLRHLLCLDQRTGQTEVPALIANEDGIEIHRMSDDYSVVSVVEPQLLKITSPHAFKPEDVILISDCHHAEIQTIDWVFNEETEQRIRLHKPLGYPYHTPTYVGLWVEEMFYIANRNHTPTLAYKNRHTEALSSSIVAMGVQVSQHLNHTLVTIDLTLEHQKTHTLVARVRMS